jgi:hypothetical protein
MDAATGRRRVRARRLGQELQIPVYDVQLVGYPQRMRDYDARRRAERRRAAEGADPGGGWASGEGTYDADL